MGRPVKKINVTQRFKNEHLMETYPTTQNGAKDAAIRRFERENQVEKGKTNKLLRQNLWMNPASFTDISEEKLKNKLIGNQDAKVSESKRALSYRGEQQLAHPLKAERRTVTIHQLDPNSDEGKQFKKKPHDHPYVRVYERPNQGSIVVDFDTVSKKEMDFVVTGSWNPWEGSCEVYHYEARPLPNGDVVLPQYLDWVKDEEG